MRTVSGLLFGAALFLTGVAYERYDNGGGDATGPLIVAMILLAASILVLWINDRL